MSQFQLSDRRCDTEQFRLHVHLGVALDPCKSESSHLFDIGRCECLSGGFSTFP